MINAGWVRGKSKIGYGKTKQTVLEASKKGLTLKEVVALSGLTEAAVRSAAVKYKVVIKTDSGRGKYGVSKEAVEWAIKNNASCKEAAKKFKAKVNTVYRVGLDLGVKLRKI
jgi:D-serine deaminase-like pyridoxal phosphate-dependent protein